jgi:hypothetical protein
VCGAGESSHLVLAYARDNALVWTLALYDVIPFLLLFAFLLRVKCFNTFVYVIIRVSTFLYACICVFIWFYMFLYMGFYMYVLYDCIRVDIRVYTVLYAFLSF